MWLAISFVLFYLWFNVLFDVQLMGCVLLFVMCMALWFVVYALLSLLLGWLWLLRMNLLLFVWLFRVCLAGFYLLWWVTCLLDLFCYAGFLWLVWLLRVQLACVFGTVVSLYVWWLGFAGLLVCFGFNYCFCWFVVL